MSEVARAAGLTPSFLSQMERGVYKGASVRSMEALQAALRYPRYRFFAKAGMVAPEVAEVFARHPDEVAHSILPLKELKKPEWERFADVAAVFARHPDEVAFIVLSVKELTKPELEQFANQLGNYIADVKGAVSNARGRSEQNEGEGDSKG